MYIIWVFGYPRRPAILAYNCIAFLECMTINLQPIKFPLSMWGSDPTIFTPFHHAPRRASTKSVYTCNTSTAQCCQWLLYDYTLTTLLLHTYSGEQLCHDSEGGSVGNIYSTEHSLHSHHLSKFQKQINKELYGLWFNINAFCWWQLPGLCCTSFMAKASAWCHGLYHWSSKLKGAGHTAGERGDFRAGWTFLLLDITHRAGSM